MEIIKIKWENGHHATYNSIGEMNDAIAPNSIEKAQIRHAHIIMKSSLYGGIKSVQFNNINVSLIKE